ncbi:MAG: radical SAM protein [Candidatus Margulisiibacteriota bacterium]
MNICLPMDTVRGRDYYLNSRAAGAVQDIVPERALLRFRELVRPDGSQRFPADFTYFYPLSPHDYMGGMENMSIETYPLLAFMYLTTACRDNCIGCFAKDFTPEGGLYSWDVISRSINELSQLGLMAVKFAGRESTLSPNLGKALELAAGNGLSTALITGGDNLAAHEEQLVNNLDHFRVSLNASSMPRHQAVQNPSRNADDYETRVMNYMRIIAKRRAIGLVSGATFLVRPETADDMFATARAAKEIGFDYLRFLYITPLIESHPQREALLETIEQEKARASGLEDEEFFAFDGVDVSALPYGAVKHLDPAYWDPAFHTRVTIFADGKVIASPDYTMPPFIGRGEGTFGNLKDQSFAEIWNGAPRRSFLSSINERYALDSGFEQIKFEKLNQILRFIALGMISE